jgi:predicted ester cyclase
LGIEANKSVVRRLFDEVFNRGDFDVADEIVVQDRKIFPPLPAGRPEGLGGLKATVRSMRETLTDFRAEVEGDLVAEGDRVVAEITFRGRHTEPWRGIEAIGREVAFREVDIFVVQEGKIQEVRWITDQIGLMRQLGVPPT